MALKLANSWEGLAIDIIYRDKDPITMAVLPRNYPNLEEWLTKHLEHPQPGEHAFVYTYPVTIH